MVFDFAGRPPEVNSALMYSGPGAAPMMAAAAGWNNLAAELSTAAASYESVISELAGGEWLGPASLRWPRRRAVRGVDEHHRRRGRARRHPGHRFGGRLPEPRTR